MHKTFCALKRQKEWEMIETYGIKTVMLQFDFNDKTAPKTFSVSNPHSISFKWNIICLHLKCWLLLELCIGASQDTPNLIWTRDWFSWFQSQLFLSKIEVVHDFASSFGFTAWHNCMRLYSIYGTFCPAWSLVHSHVRTHMQTELLKQILSLHPPPTSFPWEIHFSLKATDSKHSHSSNPYYMKNTITLNF